MKVLCEFYWDCGRMGGLEGLFIIENETLEKMIGKYVYFGEVLGKHSNIEGTLEREDFTIKSEDQEFIQKLEDLLGSDLSGYNPVYYVSFDEDEEDEDNDD